MSSALAEEMAPTPAEVAAWWDTYNAVINGYFSNTTLQHLGVQLAHDRAVRLANMAHGSIVEPYTAVSPEST